MLQLIAEGKSNAEIAEILVLFKSAVSTYRSRIMNKLDLEDAAALMKFAVEYSGMLAQGNAAAKRGNKKNLQWIITWRFFPKDLRCLLYKA